MPKEKIGINNLKCMNSFTLRTPLLPVNFYNELNENAGNVSLDLKKTLNNPHISAAIKIASPNLLKQLELYRTGRIESSKKIKNLQYSLYKYLVRMSTRCTPFGLFAGFSAGTLGEKTNVLLNKSDSSVFLRYNFDALYKAGKIALAKNKKSLNIKWSPNTTLYEYGGYWRYLERSFLKNEFKYTLESILKNKFVDFVIETSSNGITYDELIDKLVLIEADKQDAIDFIDGLIDNQVLVSNLEANLTGKDFSVRINYITEVDYSIDENIRQYINTKQKLETLFANKVFDGKEIPFHIDLLKESKKVELDKKWIPKLKKVFNFFNKITVDAPSSRIEDFKTKFLKRYERRKMPLTHVLDPESGINYLKSQSLFGENTFLEGLGTALKSKKDENYLYWSKMEVALNKKLQEAHRLNKKTIQLKDSDFEGMEVNYHDLPATMFSLTEVFYLDNKERLYVDSFTGNSAAKMIARYAGVVNKKCDALVAEITDLEKMKYPDKVLAEIVHTPSAKVSNILRRPNLRDYEIPYLGNSTLNIENQISVNDIVVAVRNDRVVLESVKLKKEIVPMLTCAHNYRNSPVPIYQFLSDVSFYNYRNRIGFNWGSLTSVFKFFPRVEYKNIIISKAKWIFEKSNFPKIDQDNLKSSIFDWRLEYGLPRHVQLKEDDNFIVIDLENVFSIEVLLNEIKNEKWFVLEEFLFDENTPVINENGECYANEFLINWYNG